MREWLQEHQHTLILLGGVFAFSYAVGLAGGVAARRGYERGLRAERDRLASEALGG